MHQTVLERCRRASAGAAPPTEQRHGGGADADVRGHLRLDAGRRRGGGEGRRAGGDAHRARAEARLPRVRLRRPRRDSSSSSCRLDVRGIEQLAQFLGQGFRGGTDICGPLERVLARLAEERWQLADLLIASDGEFGATRATAAAATGAQARARPARAGRADRRPRDHRHAGGRRRHLLGARLAPLWRLNVAFAGASNDLTAMLLPRRAALAASETPRSAGTRPRGRCCRGGRAEPA